MLVWVALNMRVQHEASLKESRGKGLGEAMSRGKALIDRYKFVVEFLVDFILDDAENIETRENGVCEVNIFHEGELGIVSSFHWIRCCDDRTSRLEVCDNADLRNRYTLLLHRLVDRSSIVIIHLVELIDQTDAFIG